MSKLCILFGTLALVPVNASMPTVAQTSPQLKPDSCQPVHTGYHKMFQSSSSSKETNSGAINVTKALGIITAEHYSESCTYLHDGESDGDAAALYLDVMTARSGTAKSIVWISKHTGATLRQDVDVEMKSGGKGHQSIKFNYGAK